MKGKEISRRKFMATAQAVACGVGATTLLGWRGVAAAAESIADKAQPQPTGLVYDQRYLEHTQGGGHPESAERLRAIQRRLANTGLDQAVTRIQPSVDPAKFIPLIHSAEHIELAGRQAYDDAIWRLAVSGALTAVDAVCSGQVRNAFAAIRPPGHHAANNGEFGFCFYNNIAIAARYAQRVHGLKKVLIVDWDYHHGDGTEWAFYDDPSVLVFSTHALYAFPGTGSADRIGTGVGKGFNINVPLPRGADDKAIIDAFKQKLIPAAERFEPDLVLISAGFDARQDDPLGDFNITDEGFAELTRMVLQLAHQHAGSRVVSTLEGGYNVTGLALAVEAHLRELLKASA